jgi:cytidyltransferase-like protein
MGIFKELYEEYNHFPPEKWNARGILDSETNKDELTPRTKECSVFPGRFQPFTLGHASVVKKMAATGKKPVIALVKGKDKKGDPNNPFDVAEQVKIIEAAMKHSSIIDYEILQVSNSYVTQLIEGCRLELDLEPVIIFAGGGQADDDNRLDSYQSSYEKGKVTLDGEIVTIPEAYGSNIIYQDSASGGGRGKSEKFGVDLSGTNARRSLAGEGDRELFTDLTGSTDEKLFDSLKAKIDNLNESTTTQITELEKEIVEKKEGMEAQIKEKTKAGKSTKALETKLNKFNISNALQNKVNKLMKNII